MLQFDWYARRIALAGVFKATELYMLQDSSATHAETWKFLNRRLSEAVAIHDVLLKSDKSGKVAQEGITSAFITVSDFWVLIFKNEFGIYSFAFRRGIYLA